MFPVMQLKMQLVEAVTVNNGGTTTGGNYTADADNPITVNPVKDDAKHNTTYEVKFDGEKQLNKFL